MTYEDKEVKLTTGDLQIYLRSML